ncbi:recombinase family protein, partial [Desulfofundulus sp.]|uniref:recombinase family protein n=1 Tax=Desulfofundulus sp. TaxID=2282750 RepID=UPI003C7103FF
MARNITHPAGSSTGNRGKITDADFTLNIYRIINYLRRSRQDIEREKRTGEDTLAIQKRIMAKVLDDLGIPYDQVEEIGSGDKIETRPVFQQVLADLEQGKYNAVAAKEISPAKNWRRKWPKTIARLK